MTPPMLTPGEVEALRKECEWHKSETDRLREAVAAIGKERDKYFDESRHWKLVSECGTKDATAVQLAYIIKETALASGVKCDTPTDVTFVVRQLKAMADQGYEWKAERDTATAILTAATAAHEGVVEDLRAKLKLAADVAEYADVILDDAFGDDDGYISIAPPKVDAFRRWYAELTTALSSVTFGGGT